MSVIIKHENLIPKEILEFINRGEFENDGGMFITSIDFIADDCKLKISLNSGDEDIPNQLWEIQINNIREKEFRSEWFYDIQILSRHKLLEPYFVINKELYIKRKAENPDELLKDLYVLHRKTFGGFRKIEKFFNVDKTLDKLCEMEFGLFAKGPQTYPPTKPRNIIIRA